MVEDLSGRRRDPDGGRRWVAAAEVGAILRAILLAAVALAIGALVASQVDGRVQPAAAAPVSAR